MLLCIFIFYTYLQIETMFKWLPLLSLTKGSKNKY